MSDQRTGGTTVPAITALDGEIRLHSLTFRLAELADTFAEGGRELDARHLVEVAARAVPHAESVGLTYLAPRKAPETLAATGDLPQRVDELQYETGEGPCLQAIIEDDVELVADLAADGRWPAFARRAVVETGVRSVCAVRLVLDGEDRAALNFYASAPDAFRPLDIGAATVVASFASLVLNSDHHRQHAANLEQALKGSRTIGTAIGILMATEKLTSDQAFDRLRTTSQQLNRKLRELAEDVVRTGELPSGP